MNWRTGVRIAVAIVGLGVATTVFVISRRHQPAQAPPLEAPKLDPNVNALSGPGQLLLYDKTGAASVDVRYSESRSYDDGRMRFENAVAKGLGDKAFTLKATVLEAHQSAKAGEMPKQFEATGHFTFEGSDGMVVESARGTYDDATGVMNMPEAVTYKRGRLSGSATGATYDREQNTIALLADAVAHVQPDDKGQGAAEATAKKMFLARGQHTLRLEDDARITGDTQVLGGRAATVVFTDDESAMKHLELRGAASVTPLPNAPAGQPTMAADSITMSFQPDGITLQHATLTGQASMTTSDGIHSRSIKATWIDLFTGKDGRTVTQLNARDHVVVEIPATADNGPRTVSSNTLKATGNEKQGLTKAIFEGNPRFEETPLSKAPARGQPALPAPKKRTGSATTLELTLGGQLDAIEKAVFQQNADFRDDRVVASGEVATYDDAKDVLYLVTHDPRKPSSVTTEDMTVTAREIDVHLTSEDLAARGEVQTKMVQKPEPGKAAKESIFEEGKPVFGTADQFDYTKETGKAVYSGTPKVQPALRQEETVILANRLEFTESTNALSGTGQVDSTMFMSAPAMTANAKPTQKKYHVVADTMSYDDARREAVYEGKETKKATLTTDDGTTEARKMTFVLKKDSRDLERMVAERDVFVTTPDGYELMGDTLVYRADTELYTLTGKPSKVKSPPEKTAQPSPATAPQCKLTLSTTLEVNRKTNTTTVPGSGQTPRQTEAIACSASIRPPK